MNVKDLRQLPKTKESISIIKSFLQTSLSLSDYANAFFSLQECYLNINDYSNLIKDTISFIAENKDLKPLNYDKILLNLIKAYLNMELFHEAKETLKEFRKYVKVIDEYLVIYYDILIKKELGEPYLEEITKAIKVALPTNVKKEYLKELVFYYLKNAKYDISYNYLLNLRALTGNDYLSKSLFLLNKLGDYDEMENLINKNLDKKEHQFLNNLYLLIIKIHEKDYHKASIYEAEANANIQLAKQDERILFYKSAYNLYHEIGNNYLKENYLNLLKEEEDIIKKEERKKQRQIKKLKEDLKKEEKAIPETKIQTNFEKPTFDSSLKLSKEDEKRQIINVIDVISFSQTISHNLSLRDYLRTFFIYLDNYYHIEEENIYLYNGMIYYYIKERLYDKNLGEISFDGTILSFNNETPRFKIYNEEELKNIKNIYNNEPLKKNIKSAITIPLGDIGVYIIYFDNLDTPKETFTFFECIAKLLEGKIIKDKTDNIFREENTTLKNIIKSDIMPIKIASRLKTFYNKEAQDLLAIEENAPTEEFYKKISPKSMYEHKNTISFLEKNIGKTITLEYDYLGKIVKEKITSLKYKDLPLLISTFTDITSYEIKVSKLEEKSKLDSEYNIYTFNYLLNSFQNYLSKKTTFIKIELNTELKNLYSFDTFFQYIKEFIYLTNNFFTDGDMFRVSDNEFIITIPINDIRAIENAINSYNDYIKNIKPRSIPNLNFKTTIATLRYPVVTKVKNADLILRYLNITLNVAKIDPTSNWRDFIYSYYEDDVFEQNILDHINKSLNENKLGLILKPFFSLRKEKVIAYEANLTLDNLNIDPIYIKKIAKKKGQIEYFEKSLIKRVFLFLKEIENTTDTYLNIIISLSNETVFSDNFNTWFKNLSESYNIPLSFIRLKLDTRVRNYRIYEKNLKELYDMSLTIDTSDIRLLLQFPINSYFYSLRKLEIKKHAYLKYLNNFLKEYNIGLFIDDVLNKEDIKLLKDLDPFGISSPIYRDISDKELIKIITNNTNDN